MKLRTPIQMRGDEVFCPWQLWLLYETMKSNVKHKAIFATMKLKTGMMRGDGVLYCVGGNDEQFTKLPKVMWNSKQWNFNIQNKDPDAGWRSILPVATKPTLESLSSLHLMLRSPPRVENNGGYENMAYFIFCMFVITCNMFMLHHVLSYLIR